MQRRHVEVVVISDVHLGTYGCQASELVRYLQSIQPNLLVLNGDIVDIWQFRKHYFPQSHLEVIRQVFHLASLGTRIYYITGNHDEMLRKFTDLTFGPITLADKLVLPLGEKKAWFFHGDIFDGSIQRAKWIAKLGGWGYDLLIRINSLSNWCLDRMGRERYSFSHRIKQSVKKAVRFINDFEEAAVHLALENGYDFVICGHIHHPQLRTFEKEGRSCTYLNSGDWIENLTALEYQSGEWSLYHHQPKFFTPEKKEEKHLKLVNMEDLIKKVNLNYSPFGKTV